jgi:hypothetical protein
MEKRKADQWEVISAHPHAQFRHALELLYNIKETRKKNYEEKR